MAQAFFGGIHPNDHKAATNKKPIETLPPPARVVTKENVDEMTEILEGCME